MQEDKCIVYTKSSSSLAVIINGTGIGGHRRELPVPYSPGDCLSTFRSLGKWINP